MFDLKSVDTKDKNFGPGKYITYGIQELKINNIEVEVASTGSKRLKFSVEGQPIKEAGFEGVDGAKGPIGRITTSYMKSDKQSDCLLTFGKIADALGVRSVADEEVSKATSLEDLAAKMAKVLGGKFANFTIATEQYVGTDNKAKNSLRFPKYDFVEAIGTNPSRMKFDTNNTYHFKAAVFPDNIGTSSSATAVKQPENDLPF